MAPFVPHATKAGRRGRRRRGVKEEPADAKERCRVFRREQAVCRSTARAQCPCLLLAHVVPSRPSNANVAPTDAAPFTRAHWTGFDNPGKSLYTSIRELVENSLDAAEAIGVLPDVHIKLEEISHASFREMHGMDAKKSKQVEVEPGDENGDSEKKSAKKKAQAAKKVTAKDQCFFKLTVTDNGGGMPHGEIPKMFGTVLSGTKYGVRQERGKFGLGSKMVLIWSKMSTGLPMEIKSSQGLAVQQ